MGRLSEETTTTLEGTRLGSLSPGSSGGSTLGSASASELAGSRLASASASSSSGSALSGGTSYSYTYEAENLGYFPGPVFFTPGHFGNSGTKLSAT